MKPDFFLGPGGEDTFINAGFSYCYRMQVLSVFCSVLFGGGGVDSLNLALMYSPLIFCCTLMNVWLVGRLTSHN